MQSVPAPRFSTAARLLDGARCYGPLSALLGRARGGYILAFHNPAPALFLEQVEALRPDRPVPLAELVGLARRGLSTAGLFAITVDDGVGETVSNLAAAAQAKGWPVTFFLPTAYVDGSGGMPFQWLERMRPFLKDSGLQRELTRRMYTGKSEDYAPRIMRLAETLVRQGTVVLAQLQPPKAVTWEEVSRLSRNALFNFESHGVTHTALSALRESEVETELKRSQESIRAATGLPSRHLCYPYGGEESIGDAAASIARKYFDSAVTMRRGRIRGRDLHLLPRIPLYEKDHAALARLKVLTL